MHILHDWEKKIQKGLEEKRWNDCLQYAELLGKSCASSAYYPWIEKIYTAVLAEPSQCGNVQALQGLASLYYRDYMTRFTSKSKKLLPYTKGESCQKAKHALMLLLKHKRTPEIVYQYAQLLYRHAKDGQWKGKISDLRRQKEQAYALYDESVAMQEKWGIKHMGLYCRSCYGACRCGLELFSHRSVRQEELALAFGMPSTLHGRRADHILRLRRLYYCLHQVLKTENLPHCMDDIRAVVQSRQVYERSWDVYYLLGKLFDYASQFSLCHNRDQAYFFAERYYKYACEIDRMRRQIHQSVPGFSHMYTSLLTLYLRHHREDNFYDAWERYHPVVRFSSDFHFLSHVRWLIIKKNYDAAQHFLASHLQDGQWNAGTKRRAAVLQDLIQAAVSGKEENLRSV